ncbi:MAG: peptidase Ste24p, partial [Acidimicrobiales bacterium]|nr:peptidase Ste24p [Acidimicrobiales bacterium]
MSDDAACVDVTGQFDDHGRVWGIVQIPVGLRPIAYSVHAVFCPESIAATPRSGPAPGRVKFDRKKEGALRHSLLNAARGIVIAAVVALTGCATNTMTGRSQLMLVSEQQAIKGSASAYSGMIGGFAKKKKLELATARVQRVKEITNRLVAEAVRFRPDAASWNWEVQVIEEPKTVNAFCMAGGKMGIYTGFWEKLDASDDEVAAVMGHEIGHALASHTREKMSVGMAAGVGATLLAALVSSRSSSSFDTNRAAFTSAAALAVTLPNSREAET